MLHTALLLGVALHVRPPTPGCARPAPRCRASRLFLATEQQIGDDFFAAVLSTRAAESRAAESADLAQLREEATEALSGTERPGRKDEAWRRTDLSLLFASSFAPPPAPQHTMCARSSRGTMTAMTALGWSLSTVSSTDP